MGAFRRSERRGLIFMVGVASIFGFLTASVLARGRDGLRSDASSEIQRPSDVLVPPPSAKSYGWRTHATDARGWDGTAKVVATAVSVFVVGYLGSRILTAHDRSQALHALEGIPLVAAAFGAALVAAALFLRNFDSFLDDRAESKAQALLRQIGHRRAVERDLDQIDEEQARERDLHATPNDRMRKLARTAITARREQTDKEERLAKASRRANVTRSVWRGTSQGLEGPGAFLLFVSALIVVLAWSTEPAEPTAPSPSVAPSAPAAPSAAMKPHGAIEPPPG
jgi:hypothetical protein